MIRGLNLILIRTIWLPVSFLVMSLIVIGVWAFDRAPPLTYKGDVRIERADAHTIRVSYAVKRHRYCDLTVVRFVRDQDGYRWHMADIDYSANEIREVDAQNQGRVMLVLPVPAGARKGAMALRVRLLFYCNPLQQLIDWPIELAYTIPFYIVPEEH